MSTIAKHLKQTQLRLHDTRLDRRSHFKASELTMPPVNGGFAYVQIPCRDLNRAQKFYAAVFSWNFMTKTSTAPGPRLFMTGGEVMGGLVLVPARSATPSAPSAPSSSSSPAAGSAPPESAVADCCPTHITNYVKIHDMAVAVQRVRDAGGKIRREPFMEGSNEICDFEDTEGNVMGLVRWRYQ
jgi:predicted enzyme related to lactoylglutathione lyase